MPQLPRRGTAGGRTRPEGVPQRALAPRAMERRQLPGVLGDDTDPPSAGPADRTAHGQHERVEDRLGDPRLRALEHRDVDRPCRVVEREEDDPLPAPDRRRLRGHLHPRHHHVRAGPLPPQIARTDDAEVGEQRLEERDQVAAGVHAEDLELGAHPLGVGVLGQPKGQLPGSAHEVERQLIADPLGPRHHGCVHAIAPGPRRQVVEPTRVRDRLHDRLRDLGPPDEVAHVAERCVGPRAQDRPDLGVRDPVHVLQRQPDAVRGTSVARRGRRRGRFDDVVGLAGVDVEREDRDAVLAGVLEDQAARVHAGLVRQHAGQKVRRIVGLEPGRLIRRHREGCRVGLAEPEGGERPHLLPDPLGGRVVQPQVLLGATQEPPPDLLDLEVVGQVPSDAVGLREVAPRDRGDRPHHLLVVDDHAEGLLGPLAERGVQVHRPLHAGPSAQERRDHVGLHRAGTEQRDVDDQVLPPLGLELLQQLPLARRLDLEAPERVRGADQLERRRIVERDAVEVDLLALGAGDLVEAVAHRREHPHAEDVELEVAEELDVVLVRLDHPVALERALERDPSEQVVVGQDDAGGVQGQVTREAVEALGDAEQQLELAGVQVGARELGQLLDRPAQVVRADVREGLGHGVDLDLRQAERLADLPYRRPGAVGLDHRDTRRSVVAVAREHHVVHVLAARGLDVDVDVRQLVAHRIEEPLEHQVVADRVDVGDAGQVAHERPGGAAAARAADTHRLDVLDDVGHGQEVGRVAELVDHVELVIQALADPSRDSHAAALETAPAPLGQDRGRRPAGRRGEPGEAHGPKAEVERAPLLDLERRVAQVGPLDEQPPHPGRGLQPPLRVDAGHVVAVDRHELAHALERVGQEGVTGHQVADGVDRDRRGRGSLGQAKERADLVGRARLEPLLHADVQPIAERVLERRDRPSGCAGTTRDGEPPDR